MPSLEAIKGQENWRGMKGQQMPLVSLAVKRAREEDVLNLPCKRKREELELAKLQAKVQGLQATARAAELANIESANKLMADIAKDIHNLMENEIIDDHNRLISMGTSLRLANAVMFGS